MSRTTRNILLLAGFAFLYLPIIPVVLYSFNVSRLVTVWGGFSTRWYGALLQNEALRDALWVSLGVACTSATLATINGLLAAIALDRRKHFPTRLAFIGALYAPLVMPEIVLGLMLLLAFVALNLDRGLLTLVIAHTTLTTGVAALVIRARLAGSDRALEDAAMDLGSTPFHAFCSITLPLLAPAIVAAWLLAFTISLDDVVIASFASGPGAATLPMRIYAQVRLGVTPEINAISTLILGFVALALGTAALLTRGRLTQT